MTIHPGAIKIRPAYREFGPLGRPCSFYKLRFTEMSGSEKGKLWRGIFH